MIDTLQDEELSLQRMLTRIPFITFWGSIFIQTEIHASRAG